MARRFRRAGWCVLAAACGGGFDGATPAGPFEFEGDDRPGDLTPAAIAAPGDNGAARYPGRHLSFGIRTLLGVSADGQWIASKDSTDNVYVVATIGGPEVLLLDQVVGASFQHNLLLLWRQPPASVGEPPGSLWVWRAGSLSPVYLSEDAIYTWANASPDSERVVFVEETGGASASLVAAEADGSARAIVDGKFPYDGGSCWPLGFFLDSTRGVAARCGGDGAKAVVHFDLATGARTVYDDAIQWWPVVSPGGDRFAYLTAGGQLRAYAADGQWLADLDRGVAWKPRFTPDGDELVYPAPAGDDYEIRRAPASGGTPATVAGGGLVLDISPDSSFVAYRTAHVFSTDADLGIAGLDGPGVGTMLVETATAHAVGFTSSGARVVWMDEPSHGFNATTYSLMARGTGDGQSRKLGQGVRTGSADFAGDDRLIFVTNVEDLNDCGDLVRANTATGDVQVLARTVHFATALVPPMRAAVVYGVASGEPGDLGLYLLDLPVN